MAALLDLHPGSDHPVVSGVLEMHLALDRMHAGAEAPLAARGHATVVAELDRAARRIAALKLKVVAAADKAGVPADAGFASTEAWVARNTRTTRTHAALEVGVARELGSGGHGTIAAALDEGLVSPAHAAVILRAERDLPEGVSDTQRERVEAALVEKAQRFDPDQLRREARRAIEAVEPDQHVVDAHEDEQLRSEEQVARSRSRLGFRDNGDGTTTGHFTVPTAAAAFLRKIIDAMTSPRRMRAARTEGRREARLYDWDHRRGVAFAELLEHLPTDRLHDKTAATVVVAIDHEILQGALKAANLDTGQMISAGEARRLACGAGLIPAVLGGASVPLDLGRESRLFSEAQRVAKGLEHATCAADGCERPYAWCELHHRKPWRLGGRTDLRDAVPLCHWHHRRVHDPGFDHRYLPDGSVRFSRRP
jgi:hypothetical protein